jgi:hypothetical protein
VTERAACRTTIFIRTLITVMQTMAPLPDHRYVSMRLHYNESCPDDYEPECFRSVNGRDLTYFEEEPTTLAIGDVKTNYHQLTMKVKTSEFCETDELEDTAALGADEPLIKSEYHCTPDTQQEHSQVSQISPEYDETQAPAVASNEDDEFLQALQWAQRQDFVSHHKLAKECLIAPTKANEYCLKMYSSGILGQLNKGKRAVLANQLTQQADLDGEPSLLPSDEEPDQYYTQAVAYAGSHEKIVIRQLASHLSVPDKQAKELIQRMHREGVVGQYVQRKGAAVNQEVLSQYLDQVGASEDQIDDDEQTAKQDQVFSVDEIESSQGPAEEEEIVETKPATPASRRGQKRTLSDVLGTSAPLANSCTLPRRRCLTPLANHCA